jgi:hypothetical protein
MWVIRLRSVMGRAGGLESLLAASNRSTGHVAEFRMCFPRDRRGELAALTNCMAAAQVMALVIEAMLERRLPSTASLGRRRVFQTHRRR